MKTFEKNKKKSVGYNDMCRDRSLLLGLAIVATTLKCVAT